MRRLKKRRHPFIPPIALCTECGKALREEDLIRCAVTIDDDLAECEFEEWLHLCRYCMLDVIARPHVLHVWWPEMTLAQRGWIGPTIAAMGHQLDQAEGGFSLWTAA